MTATAFILGMRDGWLPILGQLLVSGLASASALQDLRLRLRAGAVFWFLIATAFGVSALVTAMQSNLRFDPATCVVVLCAGFVLIVYWTLRSSKNSL